MKKKLSVLEIVLYVFSAITAIMGVVSAISAGQYISEYCASYGIGVSEMLWDAINYVYSSAINGIAFALILFTLGRICHSLCSCKDCGLPETEAVEAAEELLDEEAKIEESEAVKAPETVDASESIEEEVKY